MRGWFYGLLLTLAWLISPTASARAFVPPPLRYLNPATGHTFDGRDRLVVGTAYTYDANGNTVGDAEGATYVYDAENRLIKRSGGSLDTVELAYDADGNRVRKTVTPSGGGAPTVTLYLVEDRNPTGYAQVMEELTYTEPGSTELVGYWPLGEGSGTTAGDATGNGHNGTLVNGPAWFTGLRSGALRFDGVNDGVTVPNHTDLNVGPGDNLTLGAWIQPLQNSTAYGVMSLLGKRAISPTVLGYELFLSYGKLGFQLADAVGPENYIATADLRDGGWHHVAVTLNRGATDGGRLYVDGVSVYTFNPTTHPGTLVNAELVRMGVHPQPGLNGWYKGLLDEGRLYRRALSAAEVAGLAGTRVRYVYGLDLVSQSRKADGVWTTHYYGYDGLGSVRYLTDVNGAVTDTYTYDAFGILIGQTPSTGQTVNNYRYTGEQWDADLGMYYLRARYLNPTTGRFWTQDSFEGRQSDPLSLHKYLYCHANPVNLIDPSGHESQKTIMGKQVHKKLGEEFTRGAIKLRFSGPSIATIGREIGLPIPDKIEVLFPDLLDATRKEVYEIKPMTAYGLATGFFQALGYVSLLNKIDPSGGWHLGNTWSPPSFLILPPTSGSAGGVAYISPPVGGVIFYEAVTIQQIAKRGNRTVRSSQRTQLQQQMGIATILSTMGGF